MAFDFSKLIGKIAEKYVTRVAFAKAMGLTSEQLSRRLNNRKHFSMDEIYHATELLGIPHKDIAVYFFTPKVR